MKTYLKKCKESFIIPCLWSTEYLSDDQNKYNTCYETATEKISNFIHGENLCCFPTKYEH